MQVQYTNSWLLLRRLEYKLANIYNPFTLTSKVSRHQNQIRQSYTPPHPLFCLILIVKSCK